MEIKIVINMDRPETRKKWRRIFYAGNPFNRPSPWTSKHGIKRGICDAVEYPGPPLWTCGQSS
jgi:hypothetical protein